MQDETYQFIEVNSKDINGVNFNDIIDAMQKNADSLNNNQSKINFDDLKKSILTQELKSKAA